MSIDFSKSTDGLVPAVIQDVDTLKVLMVGYMNEEALKKTNETGLVTFYSRSRKQLWTKGETSGNYLKMKDIKIDCDSDTLLIMAQPTGPVCHTGSDTCFDEINIKEDNFLYYLEDVINKRKTNPVEGSYTNKLFEKGVNKIAQKVGEEAVELIIEAKDSNDDLFLGEAADLIYHLLVLIAHRGLKLDDILAVLKKRHSK